MCRNFIYGFGFMGVFLLALFSLFAGAPFFSIVLFLFAFNIVHEIG